MIFKSDDWQDYVAGRTFSNGARFEVDQAPDPCPDRIGALLRCAQGKRVIHFGCADHPPLIETKLAQGRWLHDRLARTAERCIGLDNNAEAIGLIQSRLGRDDCLLFDLADSPIPPAVSDGAWDLMVMGEILEHVDDPVGFMRLMKTRFAPHVGSVVLSVPNALSLENVVFSFRNSECINTDHRYWFSPFTAVKVLSRAGLRPTSLALCADFPGHGAVYKTLVRRIPMLRETIVIEAAFA